MIKIAGVQMDIAFADVQANLQKMIERLTQTSQAGAMLTVFPECTTTGYCYETRDEAMGVAETVDGRTVSRMIQVCAELNVSLVFGFLEAGEDEKLYNSLVLITPAGVAGRYRKVHLPMLGVDRFTTSGDRGFEVFDAGELKVGLNICYDSSFPEAARVLALRGADLIALPTNWPPGSGLVSDVIPNARALENHVYYMSVNRVGHERGFDFIGKSKICDPTGRTLAFADNDSETILYAEIDPVFARQKHLVAVPGKHEVHRFGDRQPKAYGRITDPN